METETKLNRLDKAFEIVTEEIGAAKYVENYKHIRPFIIHFVNGVIHETELKYRVEFYK